MIEQTTRAPVVSNKDFIDAVFHSVPEGAHIYGTTFKEPPDMAPSGVWFGGPIKARSLKRKSNYTSGDANAFYVVSSFKPNGEGQVRRSKNNFAAAHVLTLDDIGDGPSAKISWDKIKLPPSFVIETSPDNAQPGYILSKPETDADLFNRVVDALIHQGLAADADPGMKGVTRYVRMPVGINNKTKYDPPHRHVLKEWRPERRYTLQDIIDAYGLVLAPPAPERSYNSVTIDVADDPYVKVLSDLHLILTGEIKDKGDGRKFIDILCPFHEEHTDRVDVGTAYYIGGGLKCWHGHCENRTFTDVRTRLRDKYEVDIRALDTEMAQAREGVGITGMEQVIATLNKRKNK
ncbi:RepB family DNA primase [Rhodospirillales bacterium]|nr:RepB family DNA primase [Rhodospirillales bacterium]